MANLLIKIGSSATDLGWLDSPFFAAGVQSVAVLAAAWFGFKAVRKQIRETETRRLKTELLEQSLASSRAMSDSASEFTSLLTRLMIEIEVFAKATAAGFDSPVPSIRFPMILAAHQNFATSGLNLVFMIEARQFVDPRLLVFRDAILSVLHDGREIFHNQFTRHIMQNLPTDNPTGGIYPYSAPSVKTAEQMSAICSNGLEVIANGQCAAADFQVEMQNLLASDLFGHRVVHRVPIDPKHIVFRLDQANEQRDWLSTETDWGRNCAKIDLATQAKLKAQE